MKVHIAFPITDEPTGGGNQFLRALRDHYAEREVYVEDPAIADVVLYNSCQYAAEVLRLKQRYPAKVFVHRVDGPIRLYNRMSDRRDAVVHAANAAMADGTVFQSEYSRRAGRDLGLPVSRHEVVIPNAPDPQVFNRVKRVLPEDGRIELVAASWSDNINKGFDDYLWLDKHLDFTRYRMRFVGRSPVAFENIEVVPPQSADAVAALFAEAHLYITASRKDPCSNSLIEAVHRGLPVVALRDGGHPELVGDWGVLFDAIDQVPELLLEIERNYARYSSGHQLPMLEEVAERYFDFIRSVYDHSGGTGRPLSWLDAARLRWAVWRA